MVNEVIMYQSMFLLGIVAFGFFSFTFDTYTETAENLSFESNLEVLTQDIGQIMIDLISQGRSMKDVSSTLEITVSIFTLSQFSSKIYTIRIDTIDSNPNSRVILVSSDSSSSKSVDISTFDTGIVNGSSQIEFYSSVKLLSTSKNQAIQYSWDGIKETVKFLQL